MVERIKITSNRILCKDTSGNITFDTNRQYLKYDTNGAFKAGGLIEAPAIVGAVSSGSNSVVYKPEYTGYPVVRRFNSQADNGSNGLAFWSNSSASSNTLSFKGRKNATNYPTLSGRAKMQVILRNHFPQFYVYQCFSPTYIQQNNITLTDANFASSYFGLPANVDGTSSTSSGHYWRAILTWTRLGGSTGQGGYRMWAQWPVGIDLDDGQTMTISPIDPGDYTWYRPGTGVITPPSTVYWAPLDYHMLSDPVSFGFTAV